MICQGETLLKVYTIFYERDYGGEDLLCILTKEDRAKEICNNRNKAYDQEAPYFYAHVILDNEGTILDL